MVTRHCVRSLHSSMSESTAKMRYQQFPDEETCHALSEMKAYYAATGTTPMQVFKDIDVANKGALTYWDFYKGFKNKGFRFEQKVAEKLMALLDRDGAGTVRPPMIAPCPQQPSAVPQGAHGLQ